MVDSGSIIASGALSPVARLLNGIIHGDADLDLALLSDVAGAERLCA